MYMVCTWKKIICYNKHCTFQKIHSEHFQQNIAQKPTKPGQKSSVNFLSHSAKHLNLCISLTLRTHFKFILLMSSYQISGKVLSILQDCSSDFGRIFNIPFRV